MNKDTFCSLPFTEIFLGPDGMVKTCCSASVAVGSLHTHSIQEILSNETAKDIREHILANKWHPSCVQCERQESQGVASERDNKLEDFIQFHGNVDSDYFKLTRLDLRWSNTCNLSCVYCYEYFSSKWANVKGISVNTIKDENENSLFTLIEKDKDHIQTILMLGGEPLLQKQNKKLIDLLSDKNFYILTNLTVPLESNAIAEKLLNNTGAHWGISFETVEDRFEYVRHGGSWKTFNDNIDYLNKNKICKKLEAHSMYSIYSAFNLVEFYEFVIEKGFTHVHWNLLESSGYNEHSNIMLLPNEFKKLAIEEIEKCQLKFPNGPGIKNLDPIKQALTNTKEEHTHHTSSFLNEFDTLENLLVDKKYKFVDLWPNIYKMLSI
jgi:organic radical activating enzyme